MCEITQSVYTAQGTLIISVCNIFKTLTSPNTVKALQFCFNCLRVASGVTFLSQQYVTMFFVKANRVELHYK